jgi:Pyridoxamine 5'-phosphate oxidase
MPDPVASRPYWPDALQSLPDSTSGLKPWSWALERLEKSHNYWISTTRPEGRPHLMLVWGLWLENAFWFSTGARTRKSKNITAHRECAIATENAAEAVIVEGKAGTISDRQQIAQVVAAYNRKYGGDVGPLLEGGGSFVFRVTPKIVFGFDENAANFAESATRWKFPDS